MWYMSFSIWFVISLSIISSRSTHAVPNGMILGLYYFFMDHSMISFGMFSLSIKWASCHCWVKCFMHVNWIQLVDGTVEFFYILANFICGFSIIVEKGMLKSPTKTMDLSISLFSSIGFCFTYLVAQVFDAYAFRIGLYSW